MEILIREDKPFPMTSSPEQSQRTPDRNPDNSKPREIRLPQNPHVLTLARMISQNRKKGVSQKEIALEIADGDERTAESLLRQYRRFRATIA